MNSVELESMRTAPSVKYLSNLDDIIDSRLNVLALRHPLIETGSLVKKLAPCRHFSQMTLDYTHVT